ncbi:Reverse transcriptase (RNA-dependent DNA polymerase) [Rhizoctonia solani]|uniref:Reverse transcriptase (RNA-dependent DNA polymerase) n=1 Tax=Rhizoctonia solani TaxID=456999 RepID=A0A8H7H122_9AGAM|nr:Reverse transcriptase (RNA-dependent DNA polymerase) [Rhizoctonia solani]
MKDKVQAIMDWPEPQNAKQVQSFLGFANFYCCFVPNFSCLARPLNNLTQKEQPWIWLEEQKAAFDAIKAEICKEPVLAHPDESNPYTLETDTSGAAMGAVPSQRKEDGCLHPVAFMSASFSPAELNYDTHDKELLAIICAFEHWRIFLEGTEQPITVFTDHKNLEYWKSARTFNRHHVHWHLMLASCNFVIAYWPGNHLQKPDALSRQPDHMDFEPSPQVMISESQEDPSLCTILLAVSDPRSMPHNIAKFKDYRIQEGLLLYQERIVVPDEPEIKKQLLSHFHDSPASGHQGRAPTLDLIKAATAEDVAQMFLEHVWKLHGTPKRTVSDRGTTFNSKFLKALYKSLQITPSFSTAYHPQSDGPTEIENQWIEAYLCPFINHRQSDWVDWLPLAEFTHNNARSKATGKLPFEIVYGHSPVISLLLEPTGLPIADDRAKQLAETIQAVQVSIKWAQECYKQADTGKPPPEFQPGDKVWLLASHITLQHPNKKLDHKQYGSFPVKKEWALTLIAWLSLRP